MKQLLFVYNRNAGKDRNWSLLSEIIQIFTESGYLVTAYPTQAAGDAGKVIASIAHHFDHVVVSGGDGTLNDAISGLITVTDAPTIGYIPLGSANDFSRNLSLPDTILDMATVAVHGVPRPCDLGLFNERPFVYVAAFGAFVDVSFSTPQQTKNLFGYSAYLIESVKRLHTLRPYELTIEHDGGSFSGQFIYGMVSNTTSVGGLARFPPGNPKIDDGLLELTLISPPADVLDLEPFFRAVMLGEVPYENSMIQTLSTSKVNFYGEEELLWTLDGENGGFVKEARVEALPAAFTVMHGQLPKLSLF